MSKKDGLGNRPDSKEDKFHSQDPRGTANANRVDNESRRLPMHSREVMNVPKQYIEEGFYYRWCADYDKGKLNQYLQAGYEFVLDDQQQRIKREGQDPVYLMRLPEKYREADIVAKRERIVTINKKRNQENRPNTDSAVPEYIPKGSGDVLSEEV